MHAGIKRLRLAAVLEDEPLLAGRIGSAEIGLLVGPTAGAAKRGGESNPSHFITAPQPVSNAIRWP
jgi:hypothetical protein